MATLELWAGQGVGLGEGETADAARLTVVPTTPNAAVVIGTFFSSSVLGGVQTWGVATNPDRSGQTSYTNRETQNWTATITQDTDQVLEVVDWCPLDGDRSLVLFNIINADLERCLWAVVVRFSATYDSAGNCTTVGPFFGEPANVLNFSHYDMGGAFFTAENCVTPYLFNWGPRRQAGRVVIHGPRRGTQGDGLKITMYAEDAGSDFSDIPETEYWRLSYGPPARWIAAGALVELVTTTGRIAAYWQAGWYSWDPYFSSDSSTVYLHFGEELDRVKVWDAYGNPVAETSWPAPPLDSPSYPDATPVPSSLGAGPYSFEDTDGRYGGSVVNRGVDEAGIDQVIFGYTGSFADGVGGLLSCLMFRTATVEGMEVAVVEDWNLVEYADRSIEPNRVPKIRGMNYDGIRLGVLAWEDDDVFGVAVDADTLTTIGTSVPLGTHPRWYFIQQQYVDGIFYFEKYDYDESASLCWFITPYTWDDGPGPEQSVPTPHSAGHLSSYRRGDRTADSPRQPSIAAWSWVDAQDRDRIRFEAVKLLPSQSLLTGVDADPTDMSRVSWPSHLPSTWDTWSGIAPCEPYALTVQFAVARLGFWDSDAEQERMQVVWLRLSGTVTPGGTITPSDTRARYDPV